MSHASQVEDKTGSLQSIGLRVSDKPMLEKDAYSKR
jgi:hypothetical protein